MSEVPLYIVSGCGGGNKGLSLAGHFRVSDGGDRMTTLSDIDVDFVRC